MIVENKIKFGYGSVAVGADRTMRILTLEYIEPPAPVGSQLKNDDYKNRTKLGKVRFCFKEDMRELRTELKSVSAENPFIEFRGYIFDFSNFNPDSVKTLDGMLVKVIMGDPLTWAC